MNNLIMVHGTHEGCLHLSAFWNPEFRDLVIYSGLGIPPPPTPEYCWNTSPVSSVILLLHSICNGQY